MITTFMLCQVLMSAYNVYYLVNSPIGRLGKLPDIFRISFRRNRLAYIFSWNIVGGVGIEYKIPFDKASISLLVTIVS